MQYRTLYSSLYSTVFSRWHSCKVAGVQSNVDVYVSMGSMMDVWTYLYQKSVLNDEDMIAGWEVMAALRTERDLVMGGNAATKAACLRVVIAM